PLTRVVDGRADRVELAGLRPTDEGHRGDDHHGDQRNHQRILHCGRATFLGSTPLQVVPPGADTCVESKEHPVTSFLRATSPNLSTGPGAKCNSPAERVVAAERPQKSRISRMVST